MSRIFRWEAKCLELIIENGEWIISPAGGTGVGRGRRIAAPVCRLARNDRGRGTGVHKGRPYGGGRGRRPVGDAGPYEGEDGVRIAAPVCGLVRNDKGDGGGGRCDIPIPWGRYSIFGELTGGRN